MDLKQAIHSRRAVGEYVGESIGRLNGVRDDPDFAVFYHAPGLILIASATQSRWTVENCLPVAPIIAGRPKSLPSPVPRKEPRIGP